jgi:hypothetical protein
MLPRTWEVSFGAITLGCRSETNARLFARELVKKGHRASARTLPDQPPARIIELHHVTLWLTE